MPENCTLNYDSRYDRTSQRLIAVFAAQLDEQLAQFKKLVKDLSVADLEWQLFPGRTTIGQLLAHLAIVEVFWIAAAPNGLYPGPKCEEKYKDVLGIGGSDDGLPLAEDGIHPDALSGFTLEKYLELLDAARKEVHENLQSWKDDILDEEFEMDKHTFSRIWILYHVLEHFACHFGQIRLLKRLLEREKSLKKNVELS
jgi:uncharacterized damage-inducible protein DinB